MREARQAWERGDFYNAGLALTGDLGPTAATFAAMILAHPPFDLGNPALRDEVVAILRARPRWNEARRRFVRLRQETLADELPSEAQQLCEAALKLVHNLQTDQQASRFDRNQAARLVMLVGRFADRRGKAHSAAALEALLRARNVALASGAPSDGRNAGDV